MNAIKSLCLCALVLLTAACGPADECEIGDQRACYTGAAGTAGQGPCLSGTQACRLGKWDACQGEILPAAEVCDGADNDCDGDVDNGVKNACGGCAAITDQPGADCSNCGTFACDGLDALTCAAPAPAPGATCVAANGCAGAFACGADRAVTCVATAEKNECGVCGGPALAEIGATCTANGCAGVNACDEAGTALACTAPVKNNCGVCGQPDVATVGDACSANDCAGTNACNATNDGVVCNAPEKNSCGLCAGPVLVGAVGDVCGGADGTCAGVLACNAAKDAYACSAPAKNNCGVCGATDVAAVGAACTAGGCEGTNGCNASKDGVVCNAPAKNECGLCAGPAVPNLSSVCTAANTCEGHLECNDADDASVCLTAIVTNACGVCGGPAITGLDAACTTTEGAPGTYVCGPTGAGVCRKNFILISEISVAGVTASDEFVELYNPNSVAVDVSNYVLYYRSATSTSAWTTGGKIGTFSPSTTMAPHSYFLFASPEYTGAAVKDKSYASTLAGAGGQVWLLNNATLPTTQIASDDATVVDMIGYGTANKFEGSAAAPVPASSSALERKATAASTATTMATAGADVAKGNGYDTNDNLADFVLQTTRTPQSSASPAETP